MSRRRFDVPKKLLGLWAGEGGESGEGGYGGEHGQADAGAGSRGGGGDGGSRSRRGGGGARGRGNTQAAALGEARARAQDPTVGGSRATAAQGRAESRSVRGTPGKTRSTAPADSGGLGTILSRATGQQRLGDQGVGPAATETQPRDDGTTGPSDETMSAEDLARQAALEDQQKSANQRQNRWWDTGGGGQTSAQQILSSYVQSQADRAWQAEERRLRELGRVDDLFSTREKFYEDIGKSILDQGKARLGELLADRTRRDKFGLASRSLLGGSADIEAENRRVRDKDDVLTNVQSLARGRQQAAKAHDSALKQSLRQNVMHGGRYTGHAAARPKLAQKSDLTSVDQRSWDSLFDSLGSALMSGRTGVQQPGARIR